MNGKIKKLLASVLIVIAANVMGQTLTVRPIEAVAGEQTMLTLDLTGATAMTALQFNLALPEGITLTDGTTTFGTATNGHTLAVVTLANGNYMFVLYSMNLNTFKDGILLSIPVIISSEAKNGEGSLSTVRFANTEAMSNTGFDTKFNVIIKTSDGIETISCSGKVVTRQTYDLFGRKFSAPARGFNILRMSDGTTMKVLIK